jgi:nucleoside-diphosphate-sugar epimerase|tara:strand:+ start:1881 stop:2723 length:843 start_codon:yes stop_codon:yes gene_type:complete
VGKKKILIVTGVTGFIGSEILRNKLFLKDYEILGLNSKNFFLLGKKLDTISQQEFLSIAQKSKHVDVLHLATFYDLNEENKEMIYKSNFTFGKEFFEELKNNDVRLVNILYTNTVFSFSSDSYLNKSTYVRSKNKFSEFLHEFSHESNINFIEVFLSNTIGKNDFRKKLIPNMVSSIKKDKNFHIQNPNSYINILDIDIITNEIYSLYQLNNRNKYSFLSKKEYLISSINNYLTSYLIENKKSKIKYKESELGNSFPSEINLKYFEFEFEKLLLEICNDM